MLSSRTFHFLPLRPFWHVLLRNGVTGGEVTLGVSLCRSGNCLCSRVGVHYRNPIRHVSLVRSSYQVTSLLPSLLPRRVDEKCRTEGHWFQVGCPVIERE